MIAIKLNNEIDGQINLMVLDMAYGFILCIQNVGAQPRQLIRYPQLNPAYFTAQSRIKIRREVV